MASDATVDAVAVPEAGQDERIPVVFTWTHGGQNVSLAASFNGWREQIPMSRSGNEFAVVQELPRGVHQYKFIVDDQWRFAPDQLKTQDGQGNMNNYIDITHYSRFQVGLQDDKDPAPPKFAQHIPDPHDYTLDAPVIPVVLHKSSFNALPPRPHGGQPLSIPNHSLCDHIYVQERMDENAPTTMAVTHRYGQKYSTTVYASRNPFGGSAAGGDCGGNPLKRAMRCGLSPTSPPT